MGWASGGEVRAVYFSTDDRPPAANPDVEAAREWWRTHEWVEVTLLEALAGDMASYLRGNASDDRVASDLIRRYDELRPRPAEVDIPGPVLREFRQRYGQDHVQGGEG